MNYTTAKIGPLLTDEEFFEALDGSIPELANVKKLYHSNDIQNAKNAFLDYAKTTVDTTRFFNEILGKKPTYTETFKAACERAMRHEMISCGTPHRFDGPVDWYSNPTFNQYKEWTWQLSRHNEIVTLSQGYYLTKNEEYASSAIELLLSWIHQAIRPEADVGSYDTKCWRTIECGIRMGSRWPTVIHSLISSDMFTADVAIDVFKSVYEHAVRIRNHYTHGNWNVMELNGLISLSIMFPFFEQKCEWLGSAMDKLFGELEKQVHPDGWQYELSTNYSEVVIRNIINVINIMNCYGHNVPDNIYRIIHKMLMIYVDLMQSGGSIPDLNDGISIPAKKFISAYYKYFPDDEIFKFIVTDGKEGKTPDYETKLHANAGIVCFRNGWKGDFVSGVFDGGKFGRAHQHEDKLQLLVYANGHALITEGNNYAYDTSDMRSYVLSSYSHNTVTVNGLSQNRRKGFKWSDELISTVEPVKTHFSQSLDRASAVYNEGYGENCERLARHEREVVFVKSPKFGLPYFIVTDKMTSDCDNSYTALWHINAEDANISNEVLRSKEIDIFSTGDVLSQDIVMGSEKPFQGWCANSTKQGDYRAIPTLQLHAKGKTAVIISVIAIKKDEDCAISSISLKNNKVEIKYKNNDCEDFEISII